MNKLLIVFKFVEKMGSLRLKTDCTKSFTYKSVSNSFDNCQTLIDAQIALFLKQCFLLDHAKFKETNQRTGFLTKSNSAYSV